VTDAGNNNIRSIILSSGNWNIYTYITYTCV
jgi:hypothetical protein